MTSYFYHLKFELYPTPNPTGASGDQQAEQAHLWLPSPDTNVFDDLPSHPHPVRPATGAVPSSETSHSFSADGPCSSLASSSLDSLPDGVIDCGVSRAPVRRSDKRLEIITERQWLERVNSYPPPPSSAALRPQTAVKDWRFGRVNIETIDPAAAGAAVGMAGESSRAGPSAAPALGPSYGGEGTATKASFIPCETKNTEVGWGVVHFYREGDETTVFGASLQEQGQEEEQEETSSLQDCTTLCIPAVPVYMSPSDLLGFVGERWLEDISHCRMVMTSSMNRYLVLLKFRDSRFAKKWKREFDGKVFNSVEPQPCHVVFVKSITFETPKLSQRADYSKAQSSSSAVSSSLKPFPPPTPNLIELPTCPLEGIRLSRLSVHEYVRVGRHSQRSGQPVLTAIWIVGIKPMYSGHAKDHWKDTAHSFALELETQHVWDYAGDLWVHRLIRDKGDGKVVELPNRSNQSGRSLDEDVVPRAKLDNIGLEYTQLLMSQLESQRSYYEEMLSKAVDKAAKAAAAAESMALQSSAATEKLNELEEKFKSLTADTIPQLERDLERERNKASKSDKLARNMGKSLQEEKRVNEGLMKRIEHLGSENEKAMEQLGEMKSEVEELKEMNRDLSMFISGQEKLKQLENEGQLEEGELQEGSASVPEKKGRRRKR
ncbi:RING finger protein ETP1 [Metarhizium brunneum]|uniref:RING finger protein ETP1 n=1 Tax=Metarhizium brunneum TaxID=500148 RepID=A0A7D5UW12_9HYPO|nr:RING finger protein ETP1 [Metarhizium brunneum]